MTTRLAMTTMLLVPGCTPGVTTAAGGALRGRLSLSPAIAIIPVPNARRPIMSVVQVLGLAVVDHVHPPPGLPRRPRDHLVDMREPPVLQPGLDRQLDNAP